MIAPRALRPEICYLTLLLRREQDRPHALGFSACLYLLERPSPTELVITVPSNVDLDAGVGEWQHGFMPAITVVHREETAAADLPFVATVQLSIPADARLERWSIILNEAVRAYHVELKGLGTPIYPLAFAIMPHGTRGPRDAERDEETTA